jgi:DNA-binding transcriptional MerR regulator
MGKHDDTDDNESALAELFFDTSDSSEREEFDDSLAPPRLLSIDEVAKQTDLPKPTLRFYEQKGLIEPPPRPPRKFRKYSPQDVERLERVKQLRDLLGFSLNEIEETMKIDSERARLMAVMRAQWRETSDKTLKATWLRDLTRLNQQQLDDVNHQLELVEGKIEDLEHLRIEGLERLREKIRKQTESAQKAISRLDQSEDDPGEAEE